MKAIVYKDELGKEQDEIDIPADARSKRRTAAREHLLEEVSHFDDALLELLLEEAEVPDARCSRRAIRKATLSTQADPGAVWLLVQEQGRAAAARRGHRLPALAAGRARRSSAPN